MGKLIKTALVFIGGMTAGGYCVVNAALKSETFTTALKDAITKKTTEILYGTECERPKRKVPRNDTYQKSRNNDRCMKNLVDVVFDNRKDAETVLDAMMDIIDQYGVISLADVYDILEIPTIDSASKYGWVSVDNGKVVRERDGYHIRLPDAFKIK